jgi:1-deoxy-D-xylulose-5-phosphate reductoisomerase
MNAANEVAVASFLAGSCSYVGIADTVEAVMDSAPRECVTDLAQLERVDAHARQKAHAFIEQHF